MSGCHPLSAATWICDMDRDVITVLSEWGNHDNAFGDNQESVRSNSESSVDCMCSSPETCFSGENREMKDFSFEFSTRKMTSAAQPRQTKAKMSTKRRMKASEREKMRMRSLAEALHQLRDYLPKDYSKSGQPLTKIQTLKYTIEYINKLSDTLRRA